MDARPSAALPDAQSLLGFRWVAGIGMLVGTMSSAMGWSPSWDLLTAMGLTAVVLVSNLGLLKLRPGVQGFGLVLLADIGIVTALLVMSGGAGTPYSFVYTFPVVVGALLLPAQHAWGLLTAAVAAYLSLFWLAPAELHHHGPEAMRGHLLGMFVGFAITAVVVTGAVTSLRRAQHRAEAQLAEARRLEASSQRVSALATLAAGAAHELASPLSTILLVSRELRGELPAHREDLDLVAEEVGRCQDVLQQLSAQAGQGIGEVWVEEDLSELVRDAVPDADNQASGRALLPPRLTRQVLRRLVGNARDAGAGHIVVRCSTGEETCLEVQDDGAGMGPEQLERACEPFYTTRPAGRGLGLYFCSSVAAELGGRLEIRSSLGEGSTLRLILPGGGPRASA